MSSRFRVITLICVHRVAGPWLFPLPPWPSPVSELTFEASPVNRLPGAPAAVQALPLSLQVRSLRDLHSPSETLHSRWTVDGPPLLQFTLSAPPPALPCASTPGRRCRLPLVEQCQLSDRVPSSWSLTTSTVCSAHGPSGLLHPESGRGVRRVSSSCHPPALIASDTEVPAALILDWGDVE